MTDETPGIGHNQPPAHEAIAASLADLEVEAKNWLDGTAIANDAQAAAVAKLKEEAKALLDAAEEKRKAAVKPIDEARAAVQELWTPLTKRATRITDVAKRLTAAWLIEVDRKQREAAAEAAAEAARKQREAEAAAAATRNSTDLAAVDAAEEAIKDAERARREAAKAEKARPRASGGSGRAMGLRTYRIPAVDDLNAAVRHFWSQPHLRADFEALVLRLAKDEIAMGKRTIPGITITEERRAA